VLLLDPIAATALKELLTSEPALPLALDASTREVLTEVGNILLNACIGTFGNLLHVPIGFSVPEINVASVKSVIDALTTGHEAFRYALVVTAGFRLRNAGVTGYVVIVLSVQSLTRLLIAVDSWERGQS
jgi:chemotaxis protein CheC